VRASDRWVFWRLGVRARAGYGAADVAARGNVVRGAPAFKTVSFSHFQTKFSPKIQTEVL
jgi:hypothetical protein